MWDRFTKHGQLAIHHAIDTAQGVGHNQIGPEHLLVGVLSLQSYLDVPRRVLEELGAPVDVLRHEAVAQLQPSAADPAARGIELTPAGKRVLDAAWNEARSLDNDYVGAENLLLGILAADDTPAARLLERHRVTLEAVRMAIRKLSDP